MDKLLPMSRPTIMDVARKCGVSKTTVSVILNDSPASARVPVETRDRIRAAAEELGYRPSWRGRVLASQKTHMIGVIYAPPMPLIVRGNYEGIMAGIHQVLQEQGYHILFVPLGEDTAHWAGILQDQRMDGALVLSRFQEPLASTLMRVRMPFCLVNADSDLPVHRVLADDYGGSAELVRHLCDLGHERITFLLGKQPGHYSITRRVEAYRDVMRARGHERFVSVLEETVPQFVDRIAAEPARERPTAVITYQHFMATHLLQKLWDAGMRVPDDLSVGSFGNTFPVEHTIPPLSSVALPTEEMGRAAARLVMQQIQSAEAIEPRRVVLQETLTVRRSTAAPPAEG
jgi:LacI family transcriptional regulator